jgi:ribosomal protein S21
MLRSAVEAARVGQVVGFPVRLYPGLDGESAARKQGKPVEVRTRPGEAFEGLLRRFKQAVERSGLLGDYRRHQTFLSPGEKQRLKVKRAERKRLTRLKRTGPRMDRGR